MANKKISQLTDGSPAQATDQIPVNRGGANFRVNAGTMPAAGADTQVQFNDAGAFGGDANFTWDKVAGELQISNNATGGFGQIRVRGTGGGSVGSITIHSDGLDINENMTDYGTGNLVTSMSSQTTQDDGNNADLTGLYVSLGITGTNASVFDFLHSVTVDTPFQHALLGGSSLTENTGLLINDQHGIGTTNYALRIADQGSGAADYAIKVDGGRFVLDNPVVPANAGDTGTKGEIAWDANFIYVCVATNTWKRVAIATW